MQEMINEGVMEFNKKTGGQAMNVLQGETPKPIIIYYRGGGQQVPAKAPICPTPRVVIKIPTPFRYTSDKAVSWITQTKSFHRNHKLSESA